MKIGVFDSGYGGLTVLSQCLKELEATNQGHQFVYYADSDWAPYGERSAEEVDQLTRQAVQFLIEQEQIEVLIIACNTATSVAIEQLRQDYSLPIIGIEPAIRPAITRSQAGQRVLITATPLMVQSDRLKSRIQELAAEDRVDCLALPGLVQLAEQESLTWVQKQQKAYEYLKEQLRTYPGESYGAVVLGCTHFPLFLSAYQKVFRELSPNAVYFANGAEGVARMLIRQIKQKQSTVDQEAGISTITFYQSGRRLASEKEQQFQQLLKTL